MEKSRVEEILQGLEELENKSYEIIQVLRKEYVLSDGGYIELSDDPLKEDGVQVFWEISLPRGGYDTVYYTIPFDYFEGDLKSRIPEIKKDAAERSKKAKEAQQRKLKADEKAKQRKLEADEKALFAKLNEKYGNKEA